MRLPKQVIRFQSISPYIDVPSQYKTEGLNKSNNIIRCFYVIIYLIKNGIYKMLLQTSAAWSGNTGNINVGFPSKNISNENR